MNPQVLAVHASPVHGFSKRTDLFITLIEGLGVAGDAHAGRTVRHRSRVRANPAQPNLRQVHLIAAELLDEVNRDGFDVAFGALGENVTTRGIDLIGLPRATLLHLGPQAVVEVTGLRNPCGQIEAYRPGLLRRMVAHEETGAPRLRTGIMGIVRRGGIVRAGDGIGIAWPPEPHEPLDRV